MNLYGRRNRELEGERLSWGDVSNGNNSEEDVEGGESSDEDDIGKFDWQLQLTTLSFPVISVVDDDVVHPDTY